MGGSISEPTSPPRQRLKQRGALFLSTGELVSRPNRYFITLDFRGVCAISLRGIRGESAIYTRASLDSIELSLTMAFIYAFQQN